MDKSNLDQSIVVSSQSIESDDPYDVIYSNIRFLNDLQDQYIKVEELSENALRSYYVDFYLAQVNNGGFSQFVYNSGWDERTVRFIREGLESMGANRHLELFEESAAILDSLGPDGLEKFLEGEYFGENEERDILNRFDDKFYDLCEHEDLIELNSKWIKGHPSLVVMSAEELNAEVERRAATLPDREARIAEALADEPRFTKLIRALCVEAGHEFLRITAGNPNHEYNGQQVLGWHFLTNQGHFYMIDADGMAMMFDGESDKQIVSIEAPEEG